MSSWSYAGSCPYLSISHYRLKLNVSLHFSITRLTRNCNCITFKSQNCRLNVLDARTGTRCFYDLKTDHSLPDILKTNETVKNCEDLLFFYTLRGFYKTQKIKQRKNLEWLIPTATNFLYGTNGWPTTIPMTIPIPPIQWEWSGSRSFFHNMDTARLLFRQINLESTFDDILE